MKKKYFVMLGIFVLLLGGLLTGVLMNSEERQVNKIMKEYNTQFGYYETGNPETFVPLYKTNYEEGEIN